MYSIKSLGGYGGCWKRSNELQQGTRPFAVIEGQSLRTRKKATGVPCITGWSGPCMHNDAQTGFMQITTMAKWFPVP